MEYKAVLFDLDGTLVHSEPELRYTLINNTLREFGKTASRKDMDILWFRSRRDDTIRECFDLDPEKFWPVFREYDDIKLRQQFVRVYDDVAFLQELKENQYKTGIVTGAPQHIAEFEIGLLNGVSFDTVVIAKSINGIKPKPHPQGIEVCLRTLETNGEHAMYVGNADEDIEAAKSAGVLDVFIDRGEHEFPSIKPSVTIHSLYELRELLDL